MGWLGLAKGRQRARNKVARDVAPATADSGEADAFLLRPQRSKDELSANVPCSARGPIPVAAARSVKLGTSTWRHTADA
jgi:hypothetical protein